MVNIPDKEYQKLQSRLKELEAQAAEHKQIEEALRESEEKYHSVAERANDGIIIIYDGIVKYANRRLAEMYGDAVENIVGNPFKNFIAPEELPKVVERYQKRIRGESLESMYEMMIQRKDGSRMPTEVNAGTITYQGKPADLIFVRDITERKRVEEKLRDSEERFRVAQEISPDGFTILRPVRDEKGEIVDFTWIYENQAIARINGTDPQEVIGKRLLDLFPTHKGTPVFEAYLQVADTGKTRILEEFYAGMIISKPTWLRLVVVSMGEDIAILAQDITERKRAEAEIKASEEKYRALIESASDQIFMVNEELNFVSMNGAALGQLRKKLDEVIGKPVSEVFPKEISANNIKNLEKVFKTGQNSFIEEELNFGGNRVFVSTSLSPVKNIEGKTVAVLGVVRDFTERKRAEEAMAAKVKELEKMARIMEGREDRIIELKNEIKKLKSGS